MLTFVANAHANASSEVRVLRGPSYSFDGPRHVALDGLHGWILNQLGNSITEVDESTGSLVRVLSGASFGFSSPSAIFADKYHVWVTNAIANSVTEINASSGKLIRILSGGQYKFNLPRDLVGDGYHLWITNANGNSVTEITQSDGKFVRRLSGAPYRFNSPDQIVTDGTHVWVGNGHGLIGFVTEIVATTGQYVRTTHVLAAVVALTWDGQHLWISGECDSCGKDEDGVYQFEEVSIVGKVLTVVQNQQNPYSMASDSKYLWDANPYSNSIERLDVDSPNKGTYLAGAEYALNGPIVAAIGDGHVWVTNFDGNTLTLVAVGDTQPLSVPHTARLTTYGYDELLVATGGTSPYHLSAGAGSLPSGLSLSDDGYLNVQDPSAGTSTFAVNVADSSSPIQSATVTITLHVLPSVPEAQHNIQVSPDRDPLHSPSVAIILVGDWWCPLLGGKHQGVCNGHQAKYMCKDPHFQGTSPCLIETSTLVSAVVSLIERDFGDAAPGGYDAGLSHYSGVDGVPIGAGLRLRTYNGTAFAGPVALNQVSQTPYGSPPVTAQMLTINDFAGGWGIQSAPDPQAAASDTVVLELLAPVLLTCNSADGNPSGNGYTYPGKGSLYGSMPTATVPLEDFEHQCRSAPSETDLARLSPSEFATFVVSHELVEAIASTESICNSSGCSQPKPITADGLQIADVCNTRDGAGNVFTETGPYLNATRDSRGTVVSAYPDPGTRTCTPDVSKGVPTP
jgi:hypothetical protein